MSKAFLFLVTILLSCHLPNKKLVNTIIIAQSVPSKSIFSEESEISINGHRFSMRYKIIYNKGQLKNFIKYYPDSPIEYTLQELKNDPQIYKSLEIPLSHSWIIDERKMIMYQSGKIINIIKLDDHHYKESGGDKIFVVE
ncbi:MAG: hypothetical protein IPN72_11540 [Saprospiraceae bacterium]|nr:hypothetical protein [Saprospiraceae bacterium]